MAKKYAIQFQDADPVNKPLFWTGYKYQRSYQPYAELTANPQLARTFASTGPAKQSLASLRGTVVNHGTFKIIQMEVEE